jgi:hypothetical protein
MSFDEGDLAPIAIMGDARPRFALPAVCGKPEEADLTWLTLMP